MPRQIYQTDDDWDDGGTPDWRRRQAATRPKTPWQRLGIGTLFLLGYTVPFALLAVATLAVVTFCVLKDLF